jgi:hypothetical protein
MNELLDCTLQIFLNPLMVSTLGHLGIAKVVKIKAVHLDI